jgi:hypothetical protein
MTGLLPGKRIVGNGINFCINFLQTEWYHGLRHAPANAPERIGSCTRVFLLHYIAVGMISLIFSATFIWPWCGLTSVHMKVEGFKPAVDAHQAT